MSDPFANPVADPFMAQSSSGNPGVKFPNVGDMHSGVITAVKERNDTEMDGTPKTWPDGNPIKVYVMTTDNNGEIADLWVRGHMVTAIRDAAKEAGLSTVIGSKLTIKHTELGTAQRGKSPAKLFRAKLEPAPARAAVPDTSAPF